MPDLRLDTTELHTTAGALDRVATVLSGTDRAADIAAEACGHPGLAEAIRQFAENSERRRFEVAQATTDHAVRVRTTATTFDQLEDELAASLTAPAN